MSDEPEAQAHALLERLFTLLHDCRDMVLQLEAARTDSESARSRRHSGLDGLYIQRLRIATISRPSIGLLRYTDHTLPIRPVFCGQAPIPSTSLTRCTRAWRDRSVFTTYDTSRSSS
jgi:hypothetical protein